MWPPLAPVPRSGVLAKMPSAPSRTSRPGSRRKWGSAEAGSPAPSSQREDGEPEESVRGASGSGPAGKQVSYSAAGAGGVGAGAVRRQRGARGRGPAGRGAGRWAPGAPPRPFALPPPPSPRLRPSRLAGPSRHRPDAPDTRPPPAPGSPRGAGCQRRGRDRAPPARDRRFPPPGCSAGERSAPGRRVPAASGRALPASPSRAAAVKDAGRAERRRPRGPAPRVQAAWPGTQTARAAGRRGSRPVQPAGASSVRSGCWPGTGRAPRAAAAADPCRLRRGVNGPGCFPGELYNRTPGRGGHPRAHVQDSFVEDHSPGPDRGRTLQFEPLELVTACTCPAVKC
ncbi:translation initiation factor IF-2-like [Moschus berezovskii]|uniref:translation initiation factor IF-2-like n=1 Tax=Moschus berezovskii TaxID=68408 RepID=UPI002443DC9D|nr:translation initiation factor IF-2-like [Moschus berezovskii]